MSIINPKEFILFNKIISKIYCLSDIEAFSETISGLSDILPNIDSIIFLLANPKNGEIISDYKNVVPKKMFDGFISSGKSEMQKQKTFSLNEIPASKSTDFFYFNKRSPNKLSSNFLYENKFYYTVCLQAVVNGSVIGKLLIYRKRKYSNFSEKELIIIKMLEPHISNMLVNIEKNSAYSTNLLIHGLTCNDKGVLIIDKALKVIYKNDIFSSTVKTTDEVNKFLHKINYNCAKIETNKSPESEHFWSYKGRHIIDKSLMCYTINKVCSDACVSKYFYIIFVESNVPIDDQKLFFLTNREIEVTELISHGSSTREIASTLNISIDTVKTHIKKIFDKTDCKSRIELMSRYFKTNDFMKESSS